MGATTAIVGVPAGSKKGGYTRMVQSQQEESVAWLPEGGLYGQQKWVQGSYGVDVFLPRGSVIGAPVAGYGRHDVIRGRALRAVRASGWRYGGWLPRPS